MKSCWQARGQWVPGGTPQTGPRQIGTSIGGDASRSSKTRSTFRSNGLIPEKMDTLSNAPGERENTLCPYDDSQNTFHSSTVQQQILSGPREHVQPNPCSPIVQLRSRNQCTNSG